MNSAYFDINDILADEQRLKVKFLCSVPWSGLTTGINDGDKDEIIDKNSIVDLPLWLALPLIKSPFADGILSRAFSTKVRADLNANAANVHLKDYSSHFYSLGLKMMAEFQDQRLSDLLYSTLMSRLSLMTRPLQCTNDIAGTFGMEVGTITGLGICPYFKMDALEQHILQLSSASRKQFDSWLRRDILKICSNEACM